jgi:Rps23 Pro-64 3,4-dihydroxylase Tpa1-like proline 4-hydroxylase
MTAKEVFRPEIFDEGYSTQLHSKFNSNKPVRHLVIDNLLQPSLADTIFRNFPPMKEMNTHYKGINEKKAEHSDLAKLDASFQQLHVALGSPEFIQWLQRITGINSLSTIEDRLGYGLHQGANGSFLDIHIDYNLHPIKKMFRKLNFILFFNKQWENDWGGHLELWDRDVKNCIQSIAPVFNRCVIFECSEISYHGYSKISVPEGITRKSCYQYYFIPVTDNVSFHDTMFKPRPKEPLVKKLVTHVKEFTKNSGKKVLLKLGWEKYLK